MKTNDGTNDGVKTGAVSEDELAGLSVEERAALSEGEDDSEALKQIAGAGTATDDDELGETDAERTEREAAEARAQTEAKAKADALAATKARTEELAAMSAEDRAVAEAEDAAKAKQAEKDEADRVAAEKQTKTKTVTDDDITTSPSVRYNAAPVEKYDEQITGLKKESTDLNAQFKAGEIEIDEFNEKQQDIQTRRETLLAQKIKADVSAEFNSQSGDREFAHQVAVFMREAMKTDGLDYRNGEIEVNGKKVSLNAELDRMVKALANDEENNGKDGTWFLVEANAIIKARYGIGNKAATESAADKVAREKLEADAARKRAPNLKVVPKTTGGLPSAVPGADGTDAEFSHLDTLDGLELEKAVARMTPDQQDRWSRQTA